MSERSEQILETVVIPHGQARAMIDAAYEGVRIAEQQRIIAIIQRTNMKRGQRQVLIERITGDARW